MSKNERSRNSVGGKLTYVKRLVGRRFLCGLVQAAEEVLDADAAVPADDARRDLVAEGEREHGRVIAELSDFRDEFAADLALQRSIVEKRHVLRPREPDHDAKAAAGRFVEQVASGRGVRADSVDAELRHQAEVFGDLRRRRKLIAVVVGGERAVRHALDEIALAPDSEEFSVRGDPVRRHRPRFATQAWIVLDYSAHNRWKPFQGQIPIVAGVIGRSGRCR